MSRCALHCTCTKLITRRTYNLNAVIVKRNWKLSIDYELKHHNYLYYQKIVVSCDCQCTSVRFIKLSNRIESNFFPESECSTDNAEQRQCCTTVRPAIQRPQYRIRYVSQTVADTFTPSGWYIASRRLFSISWASNCLKPTSTAQGANRSVTCKAKFSLTLNAPFDNIVNVPGRVFSFDQGQSILWSSEFRYVVAFIIAFEYLIALPW